MARILVIDDSESILAFIKGVLEEDGHTVQTAKSGIEANRYIFSQEKPDLILLDIIMPLLDGEKVVKAFRQSEISARIPIVFFSTKDEEEIKKLVKKHNVLGYIKKPIEGWELKKSVKNFLETSCSAKK